MSADNIIIAIDGPSGTGKSTTAKLIARELNVIYLDTGAMYRALTYSALSQNILSTDIKSLQDIVKSIVIDFDENNDILIDGINRETEIRSVEVSSQVSHYCQVAEVRDTLTQKQRDFGKTHSCILDGRDIGTVVFPQADFKFFLVADYTIRAERRFAELQSNGVATTLQDVEANLRHRDSLDASREIAPLRKAEDAIEIDTTHTTIHEQVELLVQNIRVVNK